MAPDGQNDQSIEVEFIWMVDEAHNGKCSWIAQECEAGRCKM